MCTRLAHPQPIKTVSAGPPQVRVLDSALLQPGQWIVKVDDAGMHWTVLDNKVIDFKCLGFVDTSPPLSALICAIHMRAALRKAEMNSWNTAVGARVWLAAWLGCSMTQR